MVFSRRSDEPDRQARVWFFVDRSGHHHIFPLQSIDMPA